MSKRPTSKTNCKNSTSSTNTYGYAIIGDTAAATLYGKRLLGNHVTTPITLINEGTSRINTDGISNTTFVADNNKISLHFIKSEKIHLINYGDHDCHDDDTTNATSEQIIQFHVPSGPLGDFIAAYFIPRLGPWFTHTTDTRAEKFFTQNTVKTGLTSQETIVVGRLSSLWNLPLVNSFIVKRPSILNGHYTFVSDYGNEANREIFLDSYQVVSQESNVNYITEATNIKFETSTTSGTYDISGSGFSLQGVKPIWKTNLYTYLRLATEGGLDPSPVQIPVFYRSVIPISQNAGNVDLTSASDLGDLVTSHVTFSLYDLHNTKNSNLVWLVQAYTTIEDLSVVDPSGKYADTGKTLLIVEAICTKNRRQTTYNTSEKEIQVRYNERLVESGYLRQFAEIVAGVHNAYTNETISVDSLVSENSTCGSSGTCHDDANVVDFSQRQSPLVTMIETVGQLYGTDLYPVLSKC